MSRVRLRLPATSANLGPGFDTLALALRMHLEIEAEAAEAFALEAAGRNAEVCAATKHNLLLTTYRAVLERQGCPVVPLHIRMQNGIPLGMGCGSSAAARLAAVALASHFGDLAWDHGRILAEACRLEGHPDNAAACWLGEFVASALDEGLVEVVRFALPPEWRAVLVMPERPLATTASRDVLPDSYTRRDVVANLQRVALLTGALAAGRTDLLARAMRDWLHQPYRAELCPLLKELLPLAGSHGIAGAALSGAGPAVLLLVESASALAEATQAAQQASAGCGPVEMLACALESEPAEFTELP
jgi:homoserine kinase